MQIQRIKLHSSQEHITCKDKDPPLFNNEIRDLLNKKKEIFRQSILMKGFTKPFTKGCSLSSSPLDIS